MPTIDGGHYFLTVLVPVKTDPIQDGTAFTSPVHALRKRLARLPPAQQTPASRDGQSPFARNTRNHFARFVIIDDVAYNGRDTENSICLILGNLFRKKKKISLVVAQPQDHLTCPFLLFTAELDAATDAERDSYLETLWATMEPELREIFAHCEHFDSVTGGESFAKYIASCQLETTMPFNDYYLEKPEDLVKCLPTWPAEQYLILAVTSAALLLAGVGALFFSGGAGPILLLLGAATFGAGIGLSYAGLMAAGAVLSALGLFFSAGMILVLLLLGAAAFGGGIWLAYTSLMAAGARPFPPGPDLPTVLKALHLQRTFTRFAIDNQRLAADQASAHQLYAAFRDFVTENQPDNLVGPTQPPGVIGI